MPCARMYLRAAWNLFFGIAYNDDIVRAQEIIGEVLGADECVLKAPPDAIAVGELGDNSVNTLVRPRGASTDYWGLKFDLLETVKTRFDAAGISIPFPQQDVWMHQVEAGERLTPTGRDRGRRGGRCPLLKAPGAPRGPRDPRGAGCQACAPTAAKPSSSGPRQ